MEVKIGVRGAPRELIVESDASASEITASVTAALQSEGGLFVLEDNKGRQVLVPVDKLAFVEIGEAEARKVGFGSL